MALDGLTGAAGGSKRGGVGASRRRPRKSRSRQLHQDVDASQSGSTKQKKEDRTGPARGKGRSEPGTRGLRQAGPAGWESNSTAGPTAEAKGESDNAGLKGTRRARRHQTSAMNAKRAKPKDEVKTPAREGL